MAGELDRPIGRATNDSFLGVGEDGPGHFVDVRLDEMRVHTPDDEPPRKRNVVLTIFGVLIIAGPWWVGVLWLVGVL